jgi:hypothetical protein
MKQVPVIFIYCRKQVPVFGLIWMKQVPVLSKEKQLFKTFQSQHQPTAVSDSLLL